MRTNRRYYYALHVQYVGDPLDSAGMVPDSEGEVVGRSFRHPAFEKGPHIRLEESARVRISGRRDGAADALALCKDELELAVGRNADAQHGDRTLFDLELHTGAGADL